MTEQAVDDFLDRLGAALDALEKKASNISEGANHVNKPNPFR